MSMPIFCLVDAEYEIERDRSLKPSREAARVICSVTEHEITLRLLSSQLSALSGSVG